MVTTLVLHILLSVLGCFVFSFSYAQRHPVFSSQIREMRILEDRSREYTLENVPIQEFKSLKLHSCKLGLYEGVVWLNLIKNDEVPVVLEFKNPLLDEITVYGKRGEKWILMGKSGDQFTGESPPMRFHQFPTMGFQEFLVKIDNFGDELNIPVSFFAVKELHKRDLSEQFLLGIYFGIIVFVLLANTLVLALLRDRTNLYYFGYLLSIILLQLEIVGYGKAYFWIDQPYFANIAPSFLGSLSVFFSILFSQSILRMKKILPNGYRVLSFFAILSFLNACFATLPFPFFYKLSVYVVNPLALIVALCLIIYGILALKKGYKPARFYLLGFVLFSIFLFVFVAHNFNLLPTNFVTEYSLVIGSFSEILCLSFALIDTFGLHKEKTMKALKQINQLQTEQNANLEKGVYERTLEIQEKNRELQKKSNEILDSIKYAKLIQESLMQKEEIFTSFFDDSFILFKPKDIVSGDFYWVKETENHQENGEIQKQTFICLADCTGHGVPGAIISVLGLRLLNGIMRKKVSYSPREGLQALNKEFNQIFTENKLSKGLSSGMDAVICSIDFQNMILYFSGAKNNLYLVRENQLMIFKGDRYSIGKSSKNSEFFLHEIELMKGDCIYLTTDGYVDQFGGLKNKKMKYTFLKDFISNQNHLPMSQQKEVITKYLSDWMGNGEQTDDICMLGIRI